MKKLKHKNYFILFFVPFVLLWAAAFVVPQLMSNGLEKKIVQGVQIGGALVLAIQYILFVAFIKPKLKSEAGE